MRRQNTKRFNTKQRGNTEDSEANGKETGYIEETANRKDNDMCNRKERVNGKGVKAKGQRGGVNRKD